MTPRFTRPLLQSPAQFVITVRNGVDALRRRLTLQPESNHCTAIVTILEGLPTPGVKLI